MMLHSALALALLLTSRPRNPPLLWLLLQAAALNTSSPAPSAPPEHTPLKLTSARAYYAACSFVRRSCSTRAEMSSSSTLQSRARCCNYGLRSSSAGVISTHTPPRIHVPEFDPRRP
eukprot:1255840-Rhodomonas_salina.1